MLPLPLRWSVSFAGAFALTTVLLMVAVGAGLMAAMEAQSKAVIAAEIERLREVHAESGATGLARAIEASDAEEVGLHLAASRAELDQIAPEQARRGGGWINYAPAGADPDEDRLGRIERLDETTWLIASVSREAIHDVRELLLIGVGWTLIIALPLTFVYGLIVSRAILRRIDAISRTARKIQNEGLAARVPLRGGDDEFDRLGASLNAMLDSIEALTKSVDQMSIGIAHDLRTPLTRIANKLESLRQNKVSEEARHAQIDDLVVEHQSVIATFDALLRLAQIESGARKSGFKQIDLSALLSEVAETYDPVVAASGRTLSAEIAPHLSFQGDRTLLVQMIANVLDNAIEHTEPGAAIMVGLAVGPRGTTLSICDNGPGIAAADREAVFERFFRLDRSRTTKGDGLGLSIVRSIARLHGIAIELADARPGLCVRFGFAVRSLGARA